MSRTSEAALAQTPIFFETLATASHCGAFDAAEIFEGIQTEGTRKGHEVESYLEDFATEPNE
jgi:hypothetical protein